MLFGACFLDHGHSYLAQDKLPLGPFGERGVYILENDLIRGKILSL